MEKQHGTHRIQKPHLIKRDAEKRTVSETEHKPIVRIPLIVRFRPIAIQPQLVIVTIQLEDMRVTISVRSVLHTIKITV